MMRLPTLWTALSVAAAVIPVFAGAAPIEVPVSAPGPLGPLAGTLTTPQGPAKAVVLILPGSGPTDRDGNNVMGIRAAPYRLLADGLMERGIASVRIDKRGMFGSASAVADANAVTIADYVSDVRSWSASARKQTGASCVWLVGHSEGGLVALAAARSPDVCGLVLVAAMGRPLGAVLRQQLQANPANAPVLDQAMAALTSLEHGKRVDTTAMHPALLPLFNAKVQAYLIDLMRYDPAKLIAGYDKPVLILQGERDLQVTVEDARRLKAADPKAQLVLLPDTNHVLKHVASDQRTENFATYADPTLPLAPGVVASVADFVLSHPAAK